MNKNSKRKVKKGFTLIELIVVLAVLAIIALIAIPNFNQIRENSKIKSDERSADLIDKAVTSLLQYDDGKVLNATYVFDGAGLTGGSYTDSPAPSVVAKAASEKLIVDILEKKPSQQNGTPDFTIVVSGVGSDKPVATVNVGTFTTLE